MSHPQIEELSDTDSDPPDMDPSDFAPVPTSSSALPTRPRGPGPGASVAGLPTVEGAPGAPSREQLKTWACLYPVYFDAGRTRAEGRRVGRAQAVANPLAREIADAVQTLGIVAALEPGKTHPKDWANPGRVKVELAAAVAAGTVRNKHDLYRKVAVWLAAHPATERTPFKLPIPGLPNPKVVAPAVPRGWKMGTILPLHSPAMTGGGISENMIKDMMKEMQAEQGGAGPAGLGGLGGLGGLLGGMGGGGGGGGGGGEGSGSEKKAKKDKKKKGKA